MKKLKEEREKKKDCSHKMIARKIRDGQKPKKEKLLGKQMVEEEEVEVLMIYEKEMEIIKEEKKEKKKIGWRSRRRRKKYMFKRIRKLWK